MKKTHLRLAVKDDQQQSMSHLYVMQRANGDVFALDDHGRVRVPLFRNSHDALMSRLRNFGMLLFKPVALDARLLKEIVPVGSAADVEFWLINDPLVNLNRGHLLEHAQLDLLMKTPVELQIVPVDRNTPHTPILSKLPQSDRKATENWEDEGGSAVKCA